MLNHKILRGRGPPELVNNQISSNGFKICRIPTSPEHFPRSTDNRNPIIIESKTRTYHGQVETECTVGRRGGVGQNWTPTEQAAQETGVARTLQGIEGTSPERLPRSTPVEPKTRTHYRPVGSGRRTAERRVGAGLGRTGRRRVDPARRQPSLLLSSESKTLSWMSLRNLSSPKPGHTTGGSGRHGAVRAAGRGDAGQNKVPTFRWPWKPTALLALQRTVNNCFERLFASTNKGNPM